MNHFTPRAQQVLAYAKREAKHFGHNYVGTEHLLLGIIKLGQGVAVTALRNMGLDLETVRFEVEKHSGPSGDIQEEGDPPLTPRVRRVITLAAEEAKTLNYNYIGTEHLLLGLLREGDGVAARVLRNLNVQAETVRNEVMKALDPNFLPAESQPSEGPKGAASEPAKEAAKTPALRAFGRDLTDLARNGKLDPVIGRADEIERVIQILCRRTKNNPVLIGEAGVGKTAIVEGLAQAIIQHNVPELLRDRLVIALDLPLMVAGTKYRGQFEERIKTVMDEIRRSGHIILFIDELHTIVGAGGAEGAMDASNILKPALSRGEIQCVGATTMDEYRKNIEKDAALERRFQSILVAPPSREQTVAILRGLRYKYEDHHHVRYSDPALDAAVALSDRYITGRFLPDKAIDVIDEAGARARIASMIRPPDLSGIEKEIDEVQQCKVTAVHDQKFEEAASLRDREKSLKAKLRETLDAWEKERNGQAVTIDVDAVRHVVAKMSGVPLQRIQEGEAARLLSMEERVRERVVGQDEAVSVICRALRRSRAELKDPRRPIGSFAFLGPTGVGKTYLAKALAEYMFGDADALIRLDMSEYMEKFNVSRLIGSPPGYIGHGEGGQLTERVRRRSYSVVLFDEVEKAHPDVMNILLQILEEGQLTDSVGYKVDFRNTIVVMTSNIGATDIQRPASMGFGNGAAAGADGEHRQLKERLEESARKHFRPEFLNRLDEVVVFRQLSRDDLSRIVTLEVANVQGRLSERGIVLALSKEATEYLIDKGFKPEYGARQLRRVVEREIEDPLAEELLKGTYGSPCRILVGVSGERLTFRARRPSGKRRGKDAV
ncbi:MAG: ATP-dependent Clp protease ATP-binding subunit [Lentisphaeria bacterium]|nr:ATP-dependent Clp protease ATP-binding subunit [Lentisphaeria bacterium]